MSKRIRIPKTDFLPVPIGRDLVGTVETVDLKGDEIQFGIGLKDRRQDRRRFFLAYAAYLTPVSSLTLFLESIFDIRLEQGETFEPEILIGRSLIVQFAPPEADGRQEIIRTKPIATQPQTEGENHEDRTDSGTDQ